MKNILLTKKFALFISIFLYSNAVLANNTCKDINTELKNNALKHLAIEQLADTSTKVDLTLSYSGFFFKENAHQEGRRVISNLKRCYKVKYSTQKTLFSYTLNIQAEK